MSASVVPNTMILHKKDGDFVAMSVEALMKN